MKFIRHIYKNYFIYNFLEKMKFSRIADELKKLRDSSEARIKLINEEENFRNYGCFLACIWQQTGVVRHPRASNKLTRFPSLFLL